MILSICSNNFVFESSTIDHQNKLDECDRDHYPYHPFLFLWVLIRLSLQSEWWIDKMMLTQNYISVTFLYMQRISDTFMTSCRPDSNNICNPRVAITDANTTIPCSGWIVDSYKMQPETKGKEKQDIVTSYDNCWLLKGFQNIWFWWSPEVNQCLPQVASESCQSGSDTDLVSSLQKL